MAAPRLVPTATEILDPPTLKARIGSLPWLKKRYFVGQRAVIGRPALERNLGYRRPGFAPTFKSFLDRESLKIIARTETESYTARDVAELFLQELLATVYRATGERIRELVITHPVESFETYRSELLFVAKRLGINELTFVDEPVAAAVGYGMSLAREQLVLVVDFGAGTLDLALVSLDPRSVEQGRARVVAKDGESLGGNDVDSWLLTAVAEQLGMSASDLDGDSEDQNYWRRVMLAEARRVKETLFFQDWTVFHYLPPAQYRGDPRRSSQPPQLEIRRDLLIELLDQHRLLSRLDARIDSVLASAKEELELGEGDIDEVLVVGGSSLLPGVYPLLEQRFGRDRVRAWQPFEAVALGASALAGGNFAQSDLVAHDYAFVTHHPETHEKQYTVIVPAGTRVPSSPKLWTGKVVPTCALGEPESLFKLVICEIADRAEGDHRMVWDAAGQLHLRDSHSSTISASSNVVVVPLNERDPVLGRLDPPHQPGDQQPRLELSFGVNRDRWLCATVEDLATGTTLLDDRPVSRLL